MQEDLDFSAELARQAVIEGEPVMLSITFTNVSQHRIRLPRDLTTFENIFLIDADWESIPDNHPLQLERERLLPAVTFPQTDEFYRQLQPDDSVTSSYDLAALLGVAGAYRFRVAFISGSGYAPVVLADPPYALTGRMLSNWLELQVEAKRR